MTCRSDGCASGGEHREDLSGAGGSGQGALTLVGFARRDSIRFFFGLGQSDRAMGR